ncbi:hypothetical protein [Burkholderia anthina]|uniref:hypothetical protein n=1 Tax=Burkholderia anthina TaxID=179879 RepID=UPI0037C193A0
MNTAVTRYRNQLLVARILSGRYQQELVVSTKASTASTDGDRITYPAAWMLADNEDVAIVMDGIIDHEAAGHGRHTDFHARRSRTPIVNRMENILEDIRIELAAGVDWPGIPRNLARMVAVLVRWGVFGNAELLLSPYLDPGALLCNAMLLNCRAKFLPGQDEHLGMLATASGRAAEQRFGMLWTEAWRLAQRAPNLTSTMEACKLAADIVKSFKLPTKPDAPEPPGVGNGSAGSEQEDGEAGSGSGPADEGEAAGPTTPDGQSGEGLTPKQRAAASAAVDSADKDLPQTDLGDLAGAAVNTHSTDARGRVALQVPKAVKGTQAVPHSWQILATRLRNSLAGDLAAELDTLVSRHRSYGYAGRELATGKLFRLRLGDGRVFRKRVDTYELDTAVTLLADVSSSMGGLMGVVDRVSVQAAPHSGSGYVGDTPVIATTRYSVTRMDVSGGAAMAIGEVLEQFEIPNEVIGFGRAYQIIKSFDDTWSSTSGRSDAVALGASATATGMAMTIALSRLYLRDEARRLLIVLTDGEAGDPEMLASAYAYAKSADVEVVTIFIGNSTSGINQTRAAMKSGGYAGQMSVVKSHAELPRCVIEAVRRSI